MLGAIQKSRHRGRGYSKLLTENDIWGRGVHANSNIVTKKNYV